MKTIARQAGGDLKNNYFFVGVAGVGMSALAQFLAG
jgi:UDP-N-acetylmuramate-alanine ligase